MPNGSDHKRSRLVSRPRSRVRSALLMCGVVLWAIGTTSARAQVASPVYLDTSTRTIETLARLDTMLAANNATEAARSLQALLDDEPHKVVPRAANQPETERVSVSVRSRVHEVLTKRPALLARYRDLFSAASDRLLAERGDDPDALAELTRRYAMTSAGAEALLRLAQWRTERADFDGAWWTLLELDSHPDRSNGTIAADAARVANELARYIPARCATLAARWSLEAGLAPTNQPALAPAFVASVALDALSTNDPIRYDELVPQPVGSIALVAGANDAWSNLNMPGSGTTQIPPWVVPVVTEDRLFINDGVLVGAWDRFTLRPIWRTTLAGQSGMNERVRVVRRSSAQRIIEDISTVGVDRDLVVVPAGLAVGGWRSGDTGVHAFGARFGEPRWSVELGELHPDLRLASVRGQPVIAGDRVLLATRTTDDARRLIVVRLVALDRDTGQLVWIRTLGSAGAQYQAPSTYTDFISMHDGVAYLGDEIGVIAAIRADNGEPVWVRAHSGTDSFRTQGDPPAWGNRPVIIAPGAGASHAEPALVYTMAPNRQHILAIDAATGAVTATREADALGSATYLLHTEDTLVGVGTSTLAAVDLVDFGNSGVRARTAPRRNAGTFEARGVVAGDDIVVPTSEGLHIFDPRGPMDEPVRTLRLDTTGAVVLARGQVITIDRMGAHAYLVWGEASALLERRILESPGDPGPAIALAELASRANRPSAILRAIDLAERAAARAPSPREARRVLFDSVASMVEPVLEPVAPSLTAPTDAGGTLGGGIAVQNAVVAPGGLATIDALLRVMDRTADMPQQVVRHRMAAASLAELRAKPEDAINAYQQVLGDPALAAADWVGLRLTTRAGLAAMQRVRELMRTHGTSIYEPFEIEANVLSRGWAQASTEPARTRADLFARAAESYPGSLRAPGLWLQSGNASQEAGDDLGAMTAWRSGLAAVLFQREITPTRTNAASQRPTDQPMNQTTNQQAGGPRETEPDSVATALASALASLLSDRGQLALAASLLGPLGEGPGGTPALSLTLPEGVTPLNSFLDRARRLSDQRRFPSIGVPGHTGTRGESNTGTETQLLARWALLATPSTADVPNDAALLHSVPERSLALFGPGLDGRLAPRWRVEQDGLPTVIRIDRAWTEVLWVTSPRDTHPRALVQRIETSTGRVAWTSPDLHRLLEPVAMAQDLERGRARVRTPMDGTVPIDQLVVVGDGEAVFVTDRLGSALALDAQTGDVLWSRRLDEITQVHRVDAMGGQMLVGGLNTRVAPGQRAESLVLSIDTRTGRAAQQFTLGTGDVRWMRQGMNGLLLVGINEGIAALDLAAGRAQWVCTEDAAMSSVEAWVLGDRLFVLDEDGAMHLLDGETGTVRRRGLRTDGRLRTDSGVFAWTIDQDRLVLGSTLGLVMYDRDGLVRGVDSVDEPVGLDQRQRIGALITPRRTREGFVTLESRTIMRTMDDGYQLHVIDDGSLRREHSAPVRLLALPDRVGVIDDHVLITASGATLVIPAPSPDGAARSPGR